MTEAKREEKLVELQRKHRQLLAKKQPLVNEYKKRQKHANEIGRKVQDISRELKTVGEQIFHLKHAGDTPHVTDHAIVRYLERVQGIDIWELKTKVMEDRNAVREGNVVVTVNEDLSDILEESA